MPINTLQILITPFEYQGVAIHPAQEKMLIQETILKYNWFERITVLDQSTILVNLGEHSSRVHKLFSMIPFDGGIYSDMVHGIMTGIRNLGKKTGLYKLHPLWVEHFTRKASSLSSLLLLIVLVALIGAPYL